MAKTEQLDKLVKVAENSAAVLYLVATPIGNLNDLSLRAIEILKSVSVVAAEDTRVVRNLTQHIKSKAKIITCNEHSDITPVFELLKRGENVAFVSDAGTPGISDPGGRLVATVRRNLPTIKIIPIPGPSALTTAIMVCGWPSDHFTFLGFLPHKKGRQTLLKSLINYSHPVFLLESVHRIEKLLGELSLVLPPEARIFVGREMTKIYETYHEGNLAEVTQKVLSEPIKGEYVVGIKI